MALDANFLKDLVDEIRPQVENLRIDKIQMPAKDMVILVLRGNHRLLLSCNANQPRIHMTMQLRDNPMQPPMFCMLLRKYLNSGVITRVEQEPLERVVTISIQASDDFGEEATYYLVVELLGRHSNIILLDQSKHIVDAVHHVDFEISHDRQILPGLNYHFPIKKDVLDIFTVSKDTFLSIIPNNETDLVKWFTSHFAIAPITARELVSKTYGDVNATHADMTLWGSVERLQQCIHSPYLLSINEKYYDFTNIAINQYGTSSSNDVYNSYSQLLDTFYEAREQQERVRTRGQDMLKLVNNLIQKDKKKILLQERDLEATKERETYRLYGELITSNLYMLKGNTNLFTCQNYYDPKCKEITIPLDMRISPQKNAEKYFKMYSKAKTAEKILTERIASTHKELDYLESVLQELLMAELEQDFLDIRQELFNGGFIKKKSYKDQKGKRSEPRKFMSSQGLLILVGRNNQMNEKLSLKIAGKRDYWFHTKAVHGSHVLLCVDNEEPNEQSIYEAAMVAAYYSQGRDAGKLSVDYTLAKYLKKPHGGYPGMVIYHANETIDVVVDEKIVKGLSV